ncbi:hypothetical protein FAES_3966 [Fibrella aestuarina BUZ 2]|uniref:Uncharacterized protein n=1 Tax=Fibrella aestuarina BUZ 2 TaxID=1166018 RepID=I0KCW4_9BACT|nr:hypothetical protein [Fibrella aestuarina]CCH01967.1 hypothetical protein FAES_3966 [Fibrella aestuarina BUZ 2]
MRTQLEALYNAQLPTFRAVRQALGEGKRGGPFLLAPHEAYASQHRPLLIVGQETNGWGEHFDDIAAQLAVYDGFTVGQRYNAKPFWNLTRQVEPLLGNAQPPQLARVRIVSASLVYRNRLLLRAEG